MESGLSSASIFFLQAAIVVGVPYTLWRLLGAGRILPLVVVQILVGVALGPGVLGQWLPEWHAALFGKQALAALNGVQWLAVTLFCFLTGLHLRETELGNAPRQVLAVSAGGMALPFALGAVAGLWLAQTLPGLVGAKASLIAFALAFGLCTAVTALPVLAAILREMGLASQPLGQLALRCAAVTDGAVWLILAVLLLSQGQADGHPGAHGLQGLLPGDSLLALVACAIAYLVAFFMVVRPLLARCLADHRRDNEALLAIALVLLLVSAFASELVGLHHVLGSFVAGLVWPRRHAAQVLKLLEPATVVVLLPFFFIAAGLRAQAAAFDNAMLAVFAVATLVAMVGKIVGVALPARAAGLDSRSAWALGTLLQTKGLVEVVVLGILLDAGILAPSSFTGLLWMALATTVLARPLTTLVLSRTSGPGAAPLPRP